jgi:signal transduction histidine kinase
VQRFNLWLRGHPWAVDVVLIAAVTLPPATWLLPVGRPGWVQAIVYAATVLPILARRRYPIGAAAAVLAACWVQYFGYVWAYELPVGDLAIELVLYNLVVRVQRRAAALVAAVGLAFYLVTMFSRTNYVGTVLTVVGCTGMIAIAWLAGEFMRARRELFAEIERRAELAESERRALARAAVAEDRNRIARELHDVLAHSVSVMVVNAEGARLMRHTDPTVVDQTLKTISTTGRNALVELRRVLEVLPADRSPQPTTARLRDLVTEAGAALSLTGDPETLPPSLSLQVFRIVQEALTNVVKHAPPDADVRVSVDTGTEAPDRRVRIEVTNTGGERPASRLPSSGRGLAGMRERVVMFDGSLVTEHTDDGGFRVVAILPVYREAPAAVGS